MSEQHTDTPATHVEDDTGLKTQPENALDHELQAIPSDADPETVYIKLSYKWGQQADIDRQDWQDHLLAFDQKKPYTKVLEAIAVCVHNKLETVAAALCKRLDDSRSCIVMQLELNSNDYMKQHVSRLDASGTRQLKDLHDLFDVEGECRPELSFTLKRREEEQLDIEHPLQRVQIRTHYDGLPSSEYIFLGHVSTTLNHEEGAIPEPLQTLPKEFRYTTTENRFYWKCSSDANQLPVVVQVPRWRLEFTYVCDMDSEVELSADAEFPEHFEPHKKFKAYIEKKQAKRFDALLGDFRYWNSEGLLKSHNFSKRDPSTYKFWDWAADPEQGEVILPEGTENSIPVAVRFIQHLESEIQSTITSDRKQYLLSGDDDFASICIQVLRDLETMKAAKDARSDPNDLGKNWDIELWVLPQKRTALCKLKPGLKLCQFLSQDFADEKDLRLFMEVHLVPAKFILDQPTRQVDQVPFRLTYDFKELPGLTTDSGMDGKSQTLYVLGGQPIKDFFFHLERFVTAELATNAPACRAIYRVANKKEYIMLRSVLQHPCPVKRRAFAFDDSGVARVSTLDDLLSDVSGATSGYGPDGEPQLHIRLELVKPYKRESFTDRMVVIRSGVFKKGDAVRSSQFHRIGHMPDKLHNQQVIPTSETYFWYVSKYSKELKRVKTYTWIFGTTHICNIEERQTAEGPAEASAMMNRNDELPFNFSSLNLPKFLNFEFEKKLIDDLIPPFTGGRLLYSFKTFGTDLSCPDPVKALPSSGISVALRLFSHLGDEAKGFSFSNTAELNLYQNDNPTTIRDVIRTGFAQDIEYGNTRALVRPPLDGQWEMQLWVLPQIPGGKTLFRYDDSGLGLHSFLNGAEGKELDTTLFMEVHLVPKRTTSAIQTSEIQTSRSGRLIKPVQRD